jgi:uncharacterized protein YggT (Ycf19 family)
MDDEKLALEESRRAQQHESVKSEVEGKVQTEIAKSANRAAPAGESQRINEVAGQFRSKAVDEVVDTEREVGRARGLARVSQIIDYLFFLLYALLGLRFLLALLAANNNTGFVQFVVTVTDPFYAPFRNIVASPSAGGGHTLKMPLLVAFIAYLLLHLAINGMLRLLAHRKTAI